MKNQQNIMGSKIWSALKRKDQNTLHGPLSYSMLFLWFLFCNLHGVAQITPTQEKEIDSLKIVLYKGISTSKKVQAYLVLSDKFKPISIDSSLFYGKKLLRLQEKDKNIPGKITALLNLGGIYRSKKKYYPNAIEVDSMALKLSLKHKIDSLEERAYDHLGITYLLLKKNKEAIANFERSLRISKKIGTVTEIATTSIRAGALYCQSGKLDKALELLLPLQDYIEQNKISYSLQSTTLSYLGSTYQLSKNNEKAIYYFDKTYKIAKENNRFGDMGVALINTAKILREDKKYNSSKKLLEEARAVGENHQIKKIQVSALRNLAYIYNDLGAYDKSYETFRESILLYKNAGDHFEEADALCSLGELYYKDKKYNASEKAFYEALEESESYSASYKGKKLAMMIHESLASIDSIKGDYKKSLNHYKKYIRLKDSLIDLDQKEKIASLEFAYETEKKDKEIKLLSAENEFQVLKAEKEKNIKIGLIIGGVLLLLLLGIAYNRYLVKSKAVDIISHQKKTIEKKHKENELLVKEIHHRVKNNLQIILSLLNSHTSKEDEKINEIIVESQNRIKSMALIHQNLYNTQNFVKVPTATYLRDLLDNIRNSYDYSHRGVQLSADIEDSEIRMTLAVPLGLIVNELVTNAYKYAFDADQNDKKITVNFNGTDKENVYKLEVLDNGSGFPKSFNIDTSGSFGLQMVQGLVAQFNGEMQLRQGQGTGFDIYILDMEAA
ncbi:MAG: tetratricopeptide repeat protein [Bacteroidota bacterium]